MRMKQDCPSRPTAQSTSRGASVRRSQASMSWSNSSSFSASKKGRSRSASRARRWRSVGIVSVQQGTCSGLTKASEHIVELALEGVDIAVGVLEDLLDALIGLAASLANGAREPEDDLVGRLAAGLTHGFKGGAAELEHLAIAGRPDGGRAGTALDQAHLANDDALAKGGQHDLLPHRADRGDLEHAAAHNIKRIGLVALLKKDLAGRSGRRSACAQNLSDLVKSQVLEELQRLKDRAKIGGPTNDH